jgi:hypothetical protein
MKKGIAVLLLLGSWLSLFAQLENKGWWTRDLVSYDYFHRPGKGGSDFERKYQRIFTQPEAGYALNKHWMVGIVTQFEYRSDRYIIPDDAAASAGTSKYFYGAGPLLRYYFPLGPRVSLMPEFFLFYSHEVATDYYSDFGTLRKTNRSTDIFGAGAFPSLVCFLTKDLALSLTVASVNYYTSKESSSFTLNINPQQWLLGVEYYFDK